MSKEGAPNDPPKPSAAVSRAREDLSLSRKVAEIVSSLYQLSNHIRTHGIEHQRIPHDSKKIITLITRCFNATSDPELDVHATRQGFEFHTHSLFGVGDRVKELAVAFIGRGVGRFIIKREVADAEIASFMAAMGEPVGEGDPFDILVQHLAELQVVNIEVERTDAEAPKPRAAAAEPARPRTPKPETAKSADAEHPEEKKDEPKVPRIKEPRLLYLALIEMMKEIQGQWAQGVEFQTRDFQFLTAQLAAIMPDDARYMLPFAMVRRYDKYEYVHPVNTCILALAAIAPQVTDTRDLQQLAKSILLMDAGAVATGPLIEMAAANVPADPTGHPIRSAIVLDQMHALSKLPVVVAFEHHLQADFSGYPTQSYRWKINFLSSVVSVAEQLDALTSGRNAVCPNEALTLLHAKIGSSITVDAYDAIYNTVGPYPPGSMVELEHGEIATVLRYKNPLRVRKITDSGKHQLNDPHTMTASIPGGRNGESRIVRAIDANTLPISILDYLA